MAAAATATQVDNPSNGAGGTSRRRRHVAGVVGEVGESDLPTLGIRNPSGAKADIVVVLLQIRDDGLQAITVQCGVTRQGHYLSGAPEGVIW